VLEMSYVAFALSAADKESVKGTIVLRHGAARREST